MATVKVDVVIIGGGYYGCYATYKLAALYPHLKFALVEKESEICTHASATNQGQFHRGYMYTAKPELAFECSKFAQVFESEFYGAINHRVRSYYGIHRDSQISSKEFESTCHSAGLPLEKTSDIKYFGRDIISTYRTTEKTINTAEMRKLMALNLFRSNIDVHLSTHVEAISKASGQFILNCAENTKIHCKVLINSSFAGMNTLHANSGIELITTRNDVFLHFMLQLPEKFKHIAATVAVGNYCSLMPSNFRGSHLLAVGGIRSIANSIDAAPTERATRQLAMQLYKSSMDFCTTMIPFLSKGELCGYTVGTRTEYRDPQTNKSMSEVKVIREHDSIENYAVLLGGKISCLSECIEPLNELIAKAFEEHPIASLSDEKVPLKSLTKTAVTL